MPPKMGICCSACIRVSGMTRPPKDAALIVLAASGRSKDTVRPGGPARTCAEAVAQAQHYDTNRRGASVNIFMFGWPQNGCGFIFGLRGSRRATSFIEHF